MYSLETLKILNRREASLHFKLHPLKRVLIPEDTLKSPDYSGGSKSDIEKRFKVTFHKEYFVDSSGFGSSSEPALTSNQFLSEISSEIKDNPDKKFYSALTGVGQFQVYVSLFYKGE
jgi:hypothetical protein